MQIPAEVLMDFVSGTRGLYGISSASTSVDILRRSRRLYRQVHQSHYFRKTFFVGGNEQWFYNIYVILFMLHFHRTADDADHVEGMYWPDICVAIRESVKSAQDGGE